MTYSYPNWTKPHTAIWKGLIERHLNLDQAITMLEVGCFEGRSTVWFADYLQYHPDSRLHCVDTWEGGEEVTRMDLFDMKLVEQNFIINITDHKESHKIQVHKGLSEICLLHLGAAMYHSFDFIYLDGSHTRRDVHVDLTLALLLLKPKGVIVVDDYYNGMHAGRGSSLRPQAAIESIADVFSDEVSHYISPSRQGIFIKG